MKNIISALAAFQAEMKPVKKENENPFFKSSYADLAAIWTAAQPMLSKHGLAVSQTFRVDLATGTTVLATGLLHSSGENFSSEMILPSTKTPQETGSAITYFRRYALSAILGIVTEDEDDDGNAAQKGSETPKDVRPPAARPAPKKLELVADTELPKAFWALTASEKKAALGDHLHVVNENGVRMVRSK